MSNNFQVPNFFDDNGKFYLVRCFACDSEHGRENYAAAVSSGMCAWCGKGTVVIPDVDMGLLNKQRLSLSEALGETETYDVTLTQQQEEAAEGILNMLNAWADSAGLSEREEVLTSAEKHTDEIEDLIRLYGTPEMIITWEEIVKLIEDPC
jgi:hypothetical protein